MTHPMLKDPYRRPDIKPFDPVSTLTDGMMYSCNTSVVSIGTLPIERPFVHANPTGFAVVDPERAKHIDGHTGGRRPWPTIKKPWWRRLFA